MMTRCHIAAFAVLLLLCTTSESAAQTRHRHEGFWIGFGIGGGVNTSANVEEGKRGGGALYVRLGGTLSQRWLLGGEISVWGRQEDSILGENSVSLTRSNATFTAMFFPSGNGGLFLKGGLGGANVEFEAGGVKFNEQGVGTTLGMGYDVRLGRNLYLTPNLDVLIQTFEKSSETTTNSLVLLTIGLTWH
jgi:hypothetical protein